jgi:tRNA threonylcarbamoyladenosine biosynthesis protein TsaE
MPLFTTHTADETFELGRRIGETLQPGDIILLRGDLGAGKSVLARGLARGLGIDCAMPSPTFTLMQPYEGRIPFYHFDLYRLDDPEEFYEAGLDEYAFGNGAAVIEWPDCADLMPDTCFEVEIGRGASDDERVITVTPMGDMLSRTAEIEAAGEKWRMEA